jgi:hypothetical protein
VRLFVKSRWRKLLNKIAACSDADIYIVHRTEPQRRVLSIKAMFVASMEAILKVSMEAIISGTNFNTAAGRARAAALTTIPKLSCRSPAAGKLPAICPQVPA